MTVNKQKERREQQLKSQARAEELAAARKAREEAKKAAAEQAAASRKEKQDAIAKRIEVGRDGYNREGGETSKDV